MPAVMKAMGTYNATFAVKSGGCSPNAGFNSISGGPLISTRYLYEVTHNERSQTVRVGPGNYWYNVTESLDGTGVNVVGGRTGEVGVGGYLLGGIPRVDIPWYYGTHGLHRRAQLS